MTNLDLYISGKHRKIIIGELGIKDVVLTKIASRLPVKIEENGQFIIQARPGKWRITITMRHKGKVSVLPQASLGNFNTDKEIWSFEPHHHLRIVDIQGPPQIDPK